MRKISLVSLMALLLCGAAGAPAKPVRPAPKAGATAPQALPVFSFMGETTEAITTRTNLNNRACVNNGDKKECADYSSPQLAGTNLKWITLGFNKGLLYEVSGGFDPDDYPTILEAFSQKYGKPKVKFEKWQAKSGASFDNVLAVWAFKGGDLTLKSLGPNLDTSVFSFVSDPNSPPAEKPKIDF